MKANYEIYEKGVKGLTEISELKQTLPIISILSITHSQRLFSIMIGYEDEPIHLTRSFK